MIGHQEYIWLVFEIPAQEIKAVLEKENDHCYNAEKKTFAHKESAGRIRTNTLRNSSLMFGSG